jgi:hypothetical protein
MRRPYSISASDPANIASATPTAKNKKNMRKTSALMIATHYDYLFEANRTGYAISAVSCH